MSNIIDARAARQRGHHRPRWTWIAHRQGEPSYLLLGCVCGICVPVAAPATSTCACGVEWYLGGRVAWRGIPAPVARSAPMTPADLRHHLSLHPTRAEAARALGVPRSTLYGWIDRINRGLELPHATGRGRPREHGDECRECRATLTAQDRARAARGLCRRCYQSDQHVRRKKKRSKNKEV